MKNKIKTLQQIRAIVQRFKRLGKRVVFTNGCYDIIHVGHIRLLQEAKKHGDALIVAINSDKSVHALKGKQRPFVPQEQRAEIVASLECVDFVVIFDELDPLRLIAELKPHVLAKGGDWTVNTIVGKEVVEKYGGEVLRLPYIEGVSSSAIAQSILKRFQNSRGNDEKKELQRS